MNINKVTITGADNNISQNDLVEISKVYPFVEWGLLFSKYKEGQQRYPTTEWIDKLLEYDINLSAHFCGWYSKEVLEEKNFQLISNLKNFKRIQLNYNFKNYIQNITDLIEFMNNNSKSIIFQYNKSNSEFLNTILDLDIPNNIHFLYDASGGRGVEIKDIVNPFKNYTGYSGGLNDINIDNICKLISENTDKSNVWIDLESGARTNNFFDLDKVIKILEIVKPYINLV